LSELPFEGDQKETFVKFYTLRYTLCVWLPISSTFTFYILCLYSESSFLHWISDIINSFYFNNIHEY
jgi:hypothetical protein